MEGSAVKDTFLSQMTHAHFNKATECRLRCLHNGPKSSCVDWFMLKLFMMFQFKIWMTVTYFSCITKKKKGILKNVKQIFLVPTDCMDSIDKKHTISSFMFNWRKKCIQVLIWGWTSDESIFIFGWTVSLHCVWLAS